MKIINKSLSIMKLTSLLTAWPCSIPIIMFVIFPTQLWNVQAQNPLEPYSVLINNDDGQQMPSLTGSTSMMTTISNGRTFFIDPKRETFIKDGQPFRYVSGSIHYFRVPEQYWMDRLQKARHGGLNAIQTYIEWSSHQPEPNIFDFSGRLNFTKYFQTAHDLGLLVIVRLGPFIASERDNMGLPYWLASKNPNMRYRTSDPTFLKYVAAWYDKMLPKLVPYLYSNGGPIIMAQVENEYGSYGVCDDIYMTWLRKIIRKYLGPQLLLFTVDGNGERLLSCGTIENVFPTVDFGPGTMVNHSFEIEHLFSIKGPSVNTEYYTGWFDVWGSAHSTTDSDSVVKTFDQMLAVNASVNFYMYHGGTSFGFMNGAIQQGRYFAPMVTSYDYDAPITESGQLTSKYFAIKKVIQKYFPDVPHKCHLTENGLDCEKTKRNSIDKQLIDKQTDLNNKKDIPGQNETFPSTNSVNITIEVDFLTDIFQLMNDTLSNGHRNGSINPIKTKWPRTFEEINLRHGFIYYEHLIDFHPSDPILLNIPVLHDRALVFINQQYRTTLSRMNNIHSTPLSSLEHGDILGLFVENQGHTCCTLKPEQKGIVSNVTLGGRILKQWKMYPLFYNWSTAMDTEIVEKFFSSNQTTIQNNLNNIPNNCACQQRTFQIRPSFYVGVFQLPPDLNSDLFLDVRMGCARKGVAFVNGFNLGRYWPVMGPQVTLYVPKYLFRKDDVNTLVLMDLENDRRDCFWVQLTERPILNGTIPDNHQVSKNKSQTG